MKTENIWDLIAAKVAREVKGNVWDLRHGSL